MDMNKFIIGGALAVGVIASVVLLTIAIVVGYDSSMRPEDTVAVNGLVPPVGVGTVKTYTTYPFIQSLTGCVNSSDGTAISIGNYTTIEGDRNGGKIVNVDPTFENETWNCSSMTYKPAITGSGSVDLFINGLAVFGLFAGIVALAVMGRGIYSTLSK